MEDLSREANSVERQRDEWGKWLPGVSGNPNGRPRKKAVLPKGLKEHLADAMMMEKVPLTNAKGEEEMVPVFEAVPRQLVRSLPGLNAKDIIAALRWMQGLRVFDQMLERAGYLPGFENREKLEKEVRQMMADYRESQTPVDEREALRGQSCV